MNRAPIEHDGILWLDIRVAAQQCGMAVARLVELADAGKLLAWKNDDVLRIPQTAAARLKRENSLMRKVANANKHRLNDTPPARSIHATREDQPVLPISSGRKGKGWAGGNPED